MPHLGAPIDLEISLTDDLSHTRVILTFSSLFDLKRIISHLHPSKVAESSTSASIFSPLILVSFIILGTSLHSLFTYTSFPVIVLYPPRNSPSAYSSLFLEENLSLFLFLVT